MENGYCSICKGLDDEMCSCEHCDGTGMELCKHEETIDLGDSEHTIIACTECGKTDNDNVWTGLINMNNKEDRKKIL